MERQLILLLSGCIFFLIPWYYADSGKLQPVDAAILMLLAFFTVLGLPGLRLINKNSVVYRLFLGLSFYSIIIFFLHFIINVNEVTYKLMIQNVYYILLVTTFVLMMTYFYKVYGIEKFYKVILYMLLIDLLLPLLSLVELKDFSSRVALTFNNANQLGFFVLVNLSIFLYVSLLAKEHGVALKKLFSLFLLNINLFFLFLSASRACYPVIVLYVISNLLIFKPRLSGYGSWLFWTIGVGIASAAMFLISYELYQHMLNTRISRMSTDYTDLLGDIYYRAVRGISANFENSGYLLFGDGTYSNSVRGTLEFHNNFVATFHQIGILGLLIYIYMNVIIIKKLYNKGSAYLAPYLCYLFYSFFHYSYRTRVNWLFLSVIIFICIYDTVSLRLKFSKVIS